MASPSENLADERPANICVHCFQRTSSRRISINGTPYYTCDACKPHKCFTGSKAENSDVSEDMVPTSESPIDVFELPLIYVYLSKDTEHGKVSTVGIYTNDFRICNNCFVNSRSFISMKYYRNEDLSKFLKRLNPNYEKSQFPIIDCSVDTCGICKMKIDIANCTRSPYKMNAGVMINGQFHKSTSVDSEEIQSDSSKKCSSEPKVSFAQCPQARLLSETKAQVPTFMSDIPPPSLGSAEILLESIPSTSSSKDTTSSAPEQLPVSSKTSVFEQLHLSGAKAEVGSPDSICCACKNKLDDNCLKFTSGTGTVYLCSSCRTKQTVGSGNSSKTVSSEYVIV